MKYRVHLREVIGDYAQEEWYENYDTANEAVKRIEHFRKHGKLGTDWYVQAKEEIETIE